jgi:hypothetical protein
MKQERRRQNDPKKPLKAPRKGLSLSPKPLLRLEGKLLRVRLNKYHAAVF